MTGDDKLTKLELLRAPFPENQVGKLPKPYRADSQKGNCPVCHGFHGLPALHLDFVGHAALTDRFLDVDPEWSWEPLALTPEGLPAFDKIGGLWIRLTICGVTRLGYGDAGGKTGANAVKETIGDALRNAGMRFGAALDLWHKGDLHDASDGDAGAGDGEVFFAGDDPQPWLDRIDQADSEKALDAVSAELVGKPFTAEDTERIRAAGVRRRAELQGKAA